MDILTVKAQFVAAATNFLTSFYWGSFLRAAANKGRLALIAKYTRYYPCKLLISINLTLFYTKRNVHFFKFLLI